MVSNSLGKRFSVKAYLFFVGTTLAIGFLGGLLGGTGGFDTLTKPPLTPPAIVFPIVWTILYILMGTAAYLVWESGNSNRTSALRLYFLQLGMNALWTLFFFRLEWRLFSFFWILAILYVVILMLFSFWKISKLAVYLTLPYVLWLAFASYLNFGFYWLNR